MQMFKCLTHTLGLHSGQANSLGNRTSQENKNFRKTKISILCHLLQIVNQNKIIKTRRKKGSFLITYDFKGIILLCLVILDTWTDGTRGCTCCGSIQFKIKISDT